MDIPIKYVAVLLRPKPKIHHRRPVAYIAEAPLVLRFQQYFCIPYIDRFRKFYSPTARSFGNVLTSKAIRWDWGSFLTVSLRYLVEMSDRPPKPTIGIQSFVGLNTA